MGEIAKVYICVGEGYINNIRQGLCGGYGTVSKYITLIKDGKSCKVRFSNHRPIREQEKNKDCDFFVGVTNFQVITAHDVALQVLKFFNDNGARKDD